MLTLSAIVGTALYVRYIVEKHKRLNYKVRATGNL